MPPSRLTTPPRTVSTSGARRTPSAKRSPPAGSPVGLVRSTRTTTPMSASALAESDTNSPQRKRISSLYAPLSNTPAARPKPAVSTTPQSRLTPIGSSTNTAGSRLTVNMSLDSAKMGGLLGNKDKFLLPPREDTDVMRMSHSTSGSSASIGGLSLSDSQPRPPSSPTNNRSVVSPRKLQLPTAISAETVGADSPGETTPGDIDSPAVPTKSSLPPRGAVTVVWDLDETLCCNRRPGRAILRPGAIDSLQTLKRLSRDPKVNCYVEVVLWTASMEVVARPVVERLDPQGDIFDHCIYRDRRWYKETGYTKDLKLLGRDINSVVIIENSPMSVYLNRKHSILVRDFMGACANDKDLPFVKRVLSGWIQANGGNVETMKADENGLHPAGDPKSIVEFLTACPNVSRNNEIIARSNVGLSSNGGYTNFMDGPTLTGGNSPTRAGARNTMPAGSGARAASGSRGGFRSPTGSPTMRSSNYGRRW